MHAWKKRYVLSTSLAKHICPDSSIREELGPFVSVVGSLPWTLEGRFGRWNVGNYV